MIKAVRHVRSFLARPESSKFPNTVFISRHLKPKGKIYLTEAEEQVFRHEM
jgi:hypothetical protein